MRCVFNKFQLTLRLYKWVFIFILIGLVIRIYILALSNGSSLISDSKGYHNVALQMDCSSKFSTYWPPALPFYLHLWHKLFGSTETVSRIAMIPWYILLCLFLFLLVRKVFDASVANISILAVTFFPTFIYHSISPLTQLPAAALLALIGYVMIKHMENPGFVYPIVLGLALGFLVLLRPSSVALLLLIVFYYIFRARKITSFTVMMAIALVIVSGWMYKAHSMTGRFVLINDANSMNLFYGNNPYTPLYKTWWLASHGKMEDGIPSGFTELMWKIESKPLDTQQRIMREIAVRYILKHPDLFLVRTASRVRCFFAFPTFTGSILRATKLLSRRASLLVILIDAIFYFAVMLSAIIFLCSRGLSFLEYEHYKIILVVTLGYAVPYWLSFSHPTYNFPLIPLFLIFSMGYIKDLMSNKSRRGLELLALGGGRRRVFTVLMIGVFCAIQVEWIVSNLSRI